jgi:hypothetical protein
MDIEKITIILPAKYLIGKKVTKISGTYKYTVVKNMKIYCKDGIHEVFPDKKGIVFLQGENSINCISADKELKWETTLEELYDFLDEELRSHQ